MIRYADSVEGTERLEFESVEKGFFNIKPENESSVDEAYEYFDSLFSKPIEAESEINRDIVDDVYSRSEDDFSFDFDVNTHKIKNALESFDSSTWEGMEITDKEKAITNLERAIAEELEINSIPSIDFFNGEPNDCGAYEPNRNVICVNRNNFDDPMEIVDTVAHHIRPGLFMDLNIDALHFQTNGRHM